VAHLPAAVSQLLLQTLLIADFRTELNTHLLISLCLLRVLLGGLHCYKLSPFQSHWGRWRYTCIPWPVCLFTVHVGSGSSPLSCGIFLPLPLLQASPLLVAGWVPLLLPSQAGLFIYNPMRDFPSPHLWHSGRTTLFAMCLFLFSSCLFITQFVFFPWVGVSLSRGLS
jgi:hypothetical protein